MGLVKLPESVKAVKEKSIDSHRNELFGFRVPPRPPL